MPRQNGLLLAFLLLIFPCIDTQAQPFKDRDDALLFVARHMQAAARVSYEGSAQVKAQYALYVEDKRMVYVNASNGDTSYTVIPYEAIDFADTGRLPKRYLNLYTAFGAFSVFQSKGNPYYTSHADLMMHDTAVYNIRRLVQAFDLLGKPAQADSVRHTFNNPGFFQLRGYQQFPRYLLKDSTGKEWQLTNAIKKANKPAVVFTWAEWCPPCIRLFDSLVQSGLNKEFTLIFIKKGNKADAGTKYKLPKGFIWWPQTLLLFDPASATDTLDNGSVPLIFWTDASGNIIREHSGFDVPVVTIRNILSAIKQQKLKPGTRYYSYFDQPVVTEAEARFKYTVEQKGNHIRLNVYFRKLDHFTLRGSLDFTLNSLGELKPVE